MNKRILIRWLIGPNLPFLIVLAFGVYGAWGGWHLILVAVNHYGNAAPASGKTDTVLDQIIPVVVKANTAFGNLADATGDWSDASKQQARDVRALLSASGRTLDAATEAGKSAKGTADAATQSLNALTDTLGEGKRTIAAAQPLLAAYTASGIDLDALLKDQSIHRTIGNLDRLSLAMAGTTENMQGMTGDGKRVADDLTKKYFTPEPWWRKVAPTAFHGTEVGVSLGCLITRAC
jgi:hypothetical protein